MIRARLTLTDLKDVSEQYQGTDQAGETLPKLTAGTVIFKAVYDEGDEVNKVWSAATPFGEVTLHVSNHEAFKQFAAHLGKKWHVDFSPADD